MELESFENDGGEVVPERGETDGDTYLLHDDDGERAPESGTVDLVNGPEIVADEQE
jgi:hypothetical protein